MANETSRSSILPQIIVAVVIALLVGGTAPWWWQELRPRPVPPPPPPEVGGSIHASCNVNPNVTSPGATSEIVIHALSSQNVPISAANVRVEVGGGAFTSDGATIAAGVTAHDGSFRAMWRAPSPAANGYEFTASVVKSGFEEARTSCTGLIQ